MSAPHGVPRLLPFPASPLLHFIIHISVRLCRALDVSTPDELVGALSSGVAHIAITRHLDLTFTPTVGEGAARVLFQPSEQLESIQVRT